MRSILDGKCWKLDWAVHQQAYAVDHLTGHVEPVQAILNIRLASIENKVSQLEQSSHAMLMIKDGQKQSTFFLKKAYKSHHQFLENSVSTTSFMKC